MNTSVLMPTLGTSSSRGSVSSWLHDDGAYVHTFDSVAEVILDNGSETVLLAPATGYLSHHYRTGASVTTAHPLGSISSGSTRAGNYTPPGDTDEFEQDASSEPSDVDRPRDPTAGSPYAVHTVEADLSAVASLVSTYGRGFHAIERVELTEYVFIIRAVADALKAYPQFIPQERSSASSATGPTSARVTIALVDAIDNEVTVRDAHHLSLAGIASAIGKDVHAVEAEDPSASGTPEFTVLGSSNPQFLSGTVLSAAPVPAVVGFEPLVRYPARGRDTQDAGNTIKLWLLSRKQTFDEVEAVGFLDKVKNRLEEACFEPELRYAHRT